MIGNVAFLLKEPCRGRVFEVNEAAEAVNPDLGDCRVVGVSW
jgi:hypothetical protein